MEILFISDPSRLERSQKVFKNNATSDYVYDTAVDDVGELLSAWG